MNGHEKMNKAGAPNPAAGLLDEALPVDEMGDEVSPLVVEAVGNALHSHFKAIADMPLPDRLLVLLAELEARERTQ